MSSRSPITKAPPPGAYMIQMTVTGFEVILPARFDTEAVTVSVPVTVLMKLKGVCPLAFVAPAPLRPALGPAGMANCTATLESGCPQLLVKVASTVAVDPTPCVCVAGARLNSEPRQGACPMTVHWIDSLPAQAPSKPPVLSTWPLSV